MKAWTLSRFYSWPKIFLVALVYFIAAKLGMLVAIPPGIVTAIWPASGIALAAMLWLGYKIWPAILIGSFFNIITIFPSGVNFGILFLTAAFIGIGAVLEAFTAAYLLIKLSGTINFFKSVYAVFIFIVCSVMFACLINAFVGTTSLLVFHLIPANLYWTNWGTWWSGDLTGVLTITPVIMAWYENYKIRITFLKTIEAIAVLVLLTIGIYIVFVQNFQLRFLIIPLIIWASFRLGARFTTIMGALLSVVVIVSTIEHYTGPGKTFYASLPAGQLFIAVIFIILLSLIATLNERDRAFKKLHEINQNLRKIVKKATQKLQQSLSLEKATLESTTDGIMVVNNEGKIIDYNQQFTKMWHIFNVISDSHDENKLQNYLKKQLINPDNFSTKMQNLLKTPEASSFDELKFLDGRIFEAYSQPQRIGKKTVGRVWSFRDVTQRKIIENQLLHQATHDPLTNLSNRALLQDRINQATFSSKPEHNVALIYFNLDRFKIINDSLGRSGGDFILLTLVDRFKQHIEKKDTLAHISSDEFVILLTDIKDDEPIKQMIEKIQEALKKPLHYQNQELHFTGSFGISLYPRDTQNAETLLKNAESAMRRAKEIGGDSYQFFTANIEEENARRLVLQNSLRSDNLFKELVPYYQPLISFKTGKIVGAEVLLYWQHPTLGLIPPTQFIPIAETSRLIIPLGEWILRMACLQSEAWKEAGLSPTRIAVNISGQQLVQNNFIETVDKVLNETKLSVDNLKLELTESILLSNNEKNLALMRALKQKGLSLVLDDFGTRYSGLDYLRQFPIDKIKIDKTFIHGVPLYSNSITIINGIVELAKNLNLKIVAEGVETKEQLAFMKALGCDEVQGFIFSPPITAVKYKSMLQKNPTFPI